MIGQLYAFRILLIGAIALLVAACGGEGGDNPPPSLENNPGLSALVVAQATLVPGFSSQTTSYTAEVANSAGMAM